jgi:hypothetical protein
VLYVCSFLCKEAFQWYQTLVDTDEVPSTFEAFRTIFLTMFGESHEVQDAQDWLKSIKQTGACAHYVSQFNQLASLTGYNEVAQRTFFYDGLKDRVKDLLLAMPPAETLVAYQNQAIQCDDRAFRREKERKRDPGLGRARNPHHQPSFSPGATPPPSSNRPEPMDVDHIQVAQRRGPLTAAERQDRISKNLCLYCGDGKCPGHLNTDDCPKLAKRRPGNGQHRTT